MSAFRLEPVYGKPTLRVMYGEGEGTAYALILPEDDGTVSLFPVRFENAPKPLTGSTLPFPDVDAVADYLEIPADRRRAA